MTERMSLKEYKGGLFAGGKKAKGKGQAIAPSERNISATVEHILNARRIYNDRLNSGSVEVLKKIKDPVTKQWKQSNAHWIRLCKKGTPDRYAILPTGLRYGAILFIEVKTHDGKLSPDQVERQAELRASGAIVINVFSVEDFVEKLDTILEEIKVYAERATGN